MKTDKLMDAITQIDEDLLNKAGELPAEKEKRSAAKPLPFSAAWIRRACAALALVLLLGGAVWIFGRPGSRQPAEQGTTAGQETAAIPEETGGVISAGPAGTPAETMPGSSGDPLPAGPKAAVLAEPVLPQDLRWDEMPQPGQSRPVVLRQKAGKAAADRYRSFFADIMLQLLSDGGEDNAVMSPVNIFMAAAMLAEISGGETRQEILDTLGVPDLDELREQAAKLWGLCYLDDGAEKLLLGSSVWLDDSLTYQEESIKRLAASYYASVFRGEMGSEAYSELFRAWLDEMTGYFLKEQLSSQSLEPGIQFMLAATVFLKTQWMQKFNENLTKPAVFHAPAGDETVPFMNQAEAARVCFRGENYRMVRLDTRQGRIWFFLPDEDGSVASMMETESFRNWLAHTDQDTVPGITPEAVGVNLSVPKLDIDASQDLTDSLMTLGIRRCLDPGQADLSPFLDLPGVCLSSAKQCSRVMIDENGVIAASAVAMSGAAAPPEKVIDLVLDRPFFLLITGPESVPLFAAVVNTVKP